MAPSMSCTPCWKCSNAANPALAETVEEQQQRLQRRIAQLFMDSGPTRSLLERANTKSPRRWETITAALDYAAEQDARAEAVQRFCGQWRGPPRRLCPDVRHKSKPLSANWPARRLRNERSRSARAKCGCGSCKAQKVMRICNAADPEAATATRGEREHVLKPHRLGGVWLA